MELWAAFRSAFAKPRFLRPEMRTYDIGLLEGRVLLSNAHVATNFHFRHVYSLYLLRLILGSSPFSVGMNFWKVPYLVENTPQTLTLSAFFSRHDH
jgi:hypothetical protein